MVKTVTACIFIFLLTVLPPLTTQLSAWYSDIGLAGLVLLLAFAVFSFHTSVDDRPLFGSVSLED